VLSCPFYDGPGKGRAYLSYSLLSILLAGRVATILERLLMTTVTISLPDSLKAFIDNQLATKGYGNVSEYFRTLLREAQAKEEEARLEAWPLSAS
jgi:hypothetical protein